MEPIPAYLLNRLPEAAVYAGDTGVAGLALAFGVITELGLMWRTWTGDVGPPQANPHAVEVDENGNPIPIGRRIVDPGTGTSPVPDPFNPKSGLENPDEPSKTKYVKPHIQGHLRKGTPTIIWFEEVPTITRKQWYEFYSTPQANTYTTL